MKQFKMNQFKIFKNKYEYILFDTQNNIFSWYDDYRGYGLISGNLEFEGYTFENKRDIKKWLVDLLNDGKWLRENEFDYINDAYEQNKYIELIKNKTFK